jgi:AraC family transcriptional regulator
MTDTLPAVSRQQTLGGGHFYGSIQKRREHHDAIFTELHHPSPRRLPAHAHELAFFALLLHGLYGERYGHEQKQFAPLSVMFRPHGIPHQDEIGPSGVRFFEIELRPAWQKRMACYSLSLDVPREDHCGGELVWLAVNLFRETLGPTGPDPLCVESLLAEIVGVAAREPPEDSRNAPPWLFRVLDKLKAEHCRRLTMDELGQEARVHPVHLSRVFRRFLGQGIGEYVHRLRIRSACRRLLEPEASLADVSFATGFADQSHFARSFRKITGMTPHVFRAALGLLA